MVDMFCFYLKNLSALFLCNVDVQLSFIHTAFHNQKKTRMNCFPKSRKSENFPARLLKTF